LDVKAKSLEFNMGFIKPEDEAELRVQYRQVLKTQGLEGYLVMLGEIATTLQIGWEILYEEGNQNGTNQ
jgi:hypothetical protein